jgi:hypothetical protein
MVLLGFRLVAFAFFALPLLLTRGNRYLGEGPDARLFIWSFAWWPHAILHGENPFYTHAVWAPIGQNLTWMTSVPGLALLFAPLTLAAGPIVSYNTAAVLMPALGAYAMFELCHYVARRLLPAIVGGYLFGFSSYVLGEAQVGHIHMDTVFVVPLIGLIVLRFLDAGISPRAFSIWLGVLVAFELLVSTELAFTLTLALVIALLLAWACAPARRARLRAILAPCAVGYGIAGVLTLPFLYFLLTGFHSGTFWPKTHAADLLNVVLPPSFNLFAGGWIAALSRGFPDLTSGQEAFVGLVTVVVVVDLARRRDAAGRMLGASFLVAVVCILGPHLVVYGHSIAPAPWGLVRHAPLIDNALPERLGVYVALISAVAVSLWLGRAPTSPARNVIALLAVLSVLPDPVTPLWTNGYSIPSFFTTAAYRGCLDTDETVLPLPTSYGTPLLWQAASGFRFRLAGGDIAAPNIPPSYTDSAGDAYITDGNHLGPSQTGIVKSYVAENGITSALVADSESAFFSGALNGLATAQSAGGILVYHFTTAPPSCFGG